ncbi:probable Brefeldin A-inhibited guanine nucleotide-exchange protein [Coccomyxa sp. Obi]|nr:probable Brefeldin A-inhibited guanine nucleotide-exchange protein [Coccomyxa sp. Obi]
MAPWGLFSGSGNDAEQDLPDTIEPHVRGVDTAFELFIDDELRGTNGEQQKIHAPLDPAVTALVAHAYLHAESSPAGRLDDGSIVAQVVLLISKCSESNGEAVQLGVVRALLTVTTAEHFVLHGDCLMQAVRSVFNIAIGADSADLQRTARSALLQMLNTIVKRVTQAAAISREASLSEERRQSVPQEANGDHQPSTSATEGGAPEGADVSGGDRQGSTDEAAGPSQDVTSNGGLGPKDASSNGADGRPKSATGGSAEATEANGSASPDEVMASAGLSVATGREGTEAEGVSGQDSGAAVEEGERRSSLTDPIGSTRTAQLASLAEQADLRGLEKALDQIEAERNAKAGEEAAAMAKAAGTEVEASPRDMRRIMMRGRKVAAWRRLSLPERDVLTVLGAICKMAARETGFGAVEQYMHAGKLLALELLVRVFENPHHHWSALRAEFCDQLRSPLCLTLLRNCTSPYDEAYSAAARLFTAVLLQPKLRSGLKAEMGAFYPLLLLRPLEAERPEPGQLMAALSALERLCGQAQFLVDLFVNYDCDLQAANLFERTVRGLARTVKAGDPGPGMLHMAGPVVNVNVAQRPRPHVLAADVALAIINALDAWAEPLKESAEATTAAGAEENTEETSSRVSTGDLQLLGAGPSLPAGANGAADSAGELARFGAAKERKHSLEAGIALFNRSPVKGVASLIGSGTVEGTPHAVAAFLREHLADLDKAQLGEYLGHHEEFSCAVMHAYIDGERFQGYSIDAALRLLLGNFRLPGEAQKIDRIMEKFAERYCRDNPGAFRSADGAYLLAFALIMLNTDAHNPQADKKLGLDDFINMCQVQNEEGAYEAILPPAELETIYGRILANELVVAAEDPPASGGAAAGGGRPRRQSRLQGKRLAAAMGMTQLTLPFRSGAQWDKQHGVGVERERLLARTRDAVARGLLAGNLWHTASNAEHARPMLQVSGEAILRALSAAQYNAPDAAASQPVLEGFTTAIRLCGVVGLDRLCEDLIAALAAAVGAHTPASPGSPAEQKQVAALAALVSLAAGPSAALIGSGWVTILRTLSAIDALQANVPMVLVEGTPQPSPSRTTSAVPSSAQPAPEAGSGALPPQQERRTSNAQHQQGQNRGPRPSGLGRFFSKSSVPGDSVAPEEEEEAISGDASEGGVKSRPPTADIQPRMAKLAQRSGPGQALADWADGPGRADIERLYMCSRVLNGDAVVIFVRALCAVSQEELVPASPEEPARTYTLGRIMDAAMDNLGRIRLIWGRLWAALSAHLVSAACHPDPRVAVLAIGHMRALVAKLLSRAELSCFTHQDEALRPFVAVLRHAESAVVREMTVQVIAQAITTHPQGLGSAWRSVLQALTVAAADSAAPVVAQALEAMRGVADALFRGCGLGHELFPDAVAALAAAARNPAAEELSIEAVWALQGVSQRLANAPALELDGLQQQEPRLHRSLSADRETAGDGTNDRQLSKPSRSEVQEPWGLLLAALALVARHDPRTAVADAAAAAALGCAQAHCGGWPGPVWASVHRRALSYIVDLPFPPSSEEDGFQRRVLGWSVEGMRRIQRHAADLLPRYFELMAANFDVAGPAILQQVVSLLVSYVVQTDEAMAVEGTQLLTELATTLAPVLDAPAWHTLLKGLSIASSTDHFSAVLNPTTREPNGYAYTRPAGQSDAEALRVRCRVTVLMQRACDAIHRAAAPHMPLPLQLQLLSVLQDTVQRAAAFNRSMKRRAEAAHVIGSTSSSDDPYTSSAPPKNTQRNWPVVRSLEAAASVAATAVAEAPEASTQPSQAAEVAPQTSASEPAKTSTDTEAASSAPDSDSASGPHQPPPDGPATEEPDALLPGETSKSEDMPQSDTAAIPSGPEKGAAQATAAGGPLIEDEQSPAPSAAPEQPVGKHTDVAEEQAEVSGLPGAAEAGKGDERAAGVSAGDAEGDGADVSGVDLTGSAGIADEEQLLPALMRQETEGGALLIAAFMRTLQSKGGDSSKAGDREAEARLLSFCRRSVADAAADAWAQHADAIGRAADAGGAALTPEGSSWDQAMRAPLTVAVLGGYEAVCGEAWRGELRALWPHLARLICSQQPSVRAALAVLLQAQLLPLIAQL